MSWGQDIAAMLRGLEKVGQALSQHQQREFARRWQNSSIRAAAQDANNRVEEKMSDAIVRQDESTIKVRMWCFIFESDNQVYFLGYNMAL